MIQGARTRNRKSDKPEDDASILLILLAAGLAPRLPAKVQ